MRVFEHGCKVNFVDQNDCFVGYSMDGQCCEYFGWYISESEEPADDPEDTKDFSIEELDPYRFDPNFYETDGAGEGYETGEEAIFKLKCYGKPDLFLHLFNYHNGYYAHGFSWCNGLVVINGCI